jgi:Icc-related predicted phosphoesterase
MKVAEPKLHVFGHIHEKYGQKQHGNTLCVNASILNERYFPKNPIQIVEV